MMADKQLNFRQDYRARIASWYNSAECDALRDTWGAYPEAGEFQTWPGFVTVTNAFLDREPDPEA